MAGDAEYKQLLDVSRTLSEVASELKKTNKDLASIAKTVSKDLPNEIKKVADSQKETTKSLNEYKKSSAGAKSVTPKVGGAEADKGREMLKAFGLEDFMGMYEEELAKLSATKTKSVKGALKNGGTIKEGGNYIVGENGAEVVNVPKGTNVVPLNVTDLLDGLNKIGEIKKLINKDGMINVEVSGGDKILIGDSPTDRYSLESIKRSIREEQAENSVRGINDKSGAEKLTILDSLNKKIEAGAASAKPESATAPSTVDEMIAKKGGLDKTTLNDFYPSKQEIEEYKAKLIKEEPELATDEDGLRYELERFKVEEADRRFQEARKKEQGSAAKSESTPTLETKAKKGSEPEKPGEAKEKKEKSKAGEKLKSGLSKLFSGAGKGASLENTVGFGDSKKVGGGNIAASATSAASSLLPKAQSKLTSAASSKVENKTTSLSVAKKAEPQPQAPSPESQPSPSPSPKSAAESAPQSATTTETPKTEENKAGGSQSSQSGGSAMPSKDLEDIKGLLASISRSLSGPLNVYNPDPFRPDSRRI